MSHYVWQHGWVAKLLLDLKELESQLTLKITQQADLISTSIAIYDTALGTLGKDASTCNVQERKDFIAEVKKMLELSEKDPYAMKLAATRLIKKIMPELFQPQQMALLAVQWSTLKHINVGKKMQDLFDGTKNFDKEKAREDFATALTKEDLLKTQALPYVHSISITNSQITLKIRSKICILHYLECAKHGLFSSLHNSHICFVRMNLVKESSKPKKSKKSEQAKTNPHSQSLMNPLFPIMSMLQSFGPQQSQAMNRSFSTNKSKKDGKYGKGKPKRRNSAPKPIM